MHTAGALICFLRLCLVVMSEELEENGACYQLVPYQPPAILPMFEQKTRNFEFVGKSWTVKQDWEDIGVASVVWESAILLATYLVQLGTSVFHGVRVIELGAGTGLVGMVASALGAAHVVLTDRDIRPAVRNLEHNRHNLESNNITSSVLVWGKDLATFDPPYDIVLAADVIYIEETFPDLIKTLVDLTGPKTLVLLACKYRYERDTQFFQMLENTGKFEDRVVKTWPDNEDITVHELRRTDLGTSEHEHTFRMNTDYEQSKFEQR